MPCGSTWNTTGSTIGTSPPFFTISNDMTAVAGQLTVRGPDGALFGLATLRAVYVPADLAGFAKLIDEHRLANNIDVVLLNPLDPRIPSFVLGVFPRAARVTADVIQQMWAVAVDELDARGLYVVATGADGDSAHLSAMKKRRVRALRVWRGPAGVAQRVSARASGQGVLFRDQGARRQPVRARCHVPVRYDLGQRRQAQAGVGHRLALPGLGTRQLEAAQSARRPRPARRAHGIGTRGGRLAGRAARRQPHGGHRRAARRSEAEDGSDEREGGLPADGREDAALRAGVRGLRDSRSASTCTCTSS